MEPLTAFAGVAAGACLMFAILVEQLCRMERL